MNGKRVRALRAGRLLALVLPLAGIAPAAGATGADEWIAPSAAAPWRAVNVAVSLGLAQTAESWEGGPVDWDRDGRTDLWLSYHDGWTPDGGAAPSFRLYRNTGSSLTSVRTLPHVKANGLVMDRHDCDWADFDHNGLLDMYCSGGRGGRNELKDGRGNELWLQGPAGSWRDAAEAWQAVERCGRSHYVAVLDVNRDGWSDVFVGNAPPRADPADPCDAEPGSEDSHLLVNTGLGGFVDESAGYGLTGVNGGARCAEAVDYDADGWTDLVVCRSDRLLVLHNDGGRAFTDRRAALGIPAVGYSDVTVANVVGDSRLDLVLVSPTSVVVRPQFSGAPRVVLTTTFARAAAAGDVTGDGRRDLYVVRADLGSRSNPTDLVLVKTATSWSTVPLPAAGGIGDYATYLPSLRAFLVGNGLEDSIGPIQVIRLRQP